MRTAALAVAGLIGGLVVGFVLSEVIAIIGFLMFDTPVGIMYLPVYTAVLCAVAVPLVDARFRAAGKK